MHIKIFSLYCYYNQSFHYPVFFSNMNSDYNLIFLDFFMLPETSLYNHNFLIFFICLVILLFSILLFFSYITGTFLQPVLFERAQPYECGFEPMTVNSGPFELQFLRISLLFLVFDLELLYLVPWSTLLLQYSLFVGNTLFYLMIPFLYLLLFSMFYELSYGLLGFYTLKTFKTNS